MTTKRMLIDASHPEETRVVIVNGTRLEDFDVELATRKQLKGNIYLAKVTRVEPSLQAAFVDYGGNRHGFLAFNEIHPDYYQIPVEDRQALIAEDAAASRAERTERPYVASAESVPESTSENSSEGESETPSEDANENPSVGEGENPSGGVNENLSAGESETPSENANENSSDIGNENPSEGAGENSSDSALENVREGSPPSANSVEFLGGDTDDDLEVRRPSPARRRHYKIQEVVKRRQILLVQVVKEERGTKGAALTTYLSLAGRYCVLMPNTDRGGGISRKIAGGDDRRRLKSIVDELEIPEGIAVIVRTAGAERTKIEINRDFEYLMRAWTEVRERTLESIAPALVYEEGSIIKRAIRDLYSNDLDEVVVAGEEGYNQAKELMRLLVPAHMNRVKLYTDEIVSIFRRYQIEDQLASIHSPQVQLRSGGYIVINPTEALVSIDVNSGRATRERHIEETALRTNLEAAEEIARQLRLRDLAGLIVIDFIDMESSRNQAQVERRLKESMRLDRARIQIGRISHFGLLEMSRQRLRPSLIETSSVPCPHCDGTGIRRATDTSALTVLRAIEDEGVRQRAEEITVHAATPIVLYILNQKRATLSELERRFSFHVVFAADDTLVPPAHRIDRTKARAGTPIVVPPPQSIAAEGGDSDLEGDIDAGEREAGIEIERAPGEDGRETETPRPYHDAPPGRGRKRRRGRGGRGGSAGERPGGEAQAARGPNFQGPAYPPGAPQPDVDVLAVPTTQDTGLPTTEEGGDEHVPPSAVGGQPPSGDEQPREGRRRRRRGRRGGRNRHRPGEPGGVASGEHRGGQQPRGPSGQPADVGFDTPQGGERPPRESGDRGGAFNARADSPVPGGFRVTTPAEAGIAFLDGPRIGGYGAEPDEQDQPTPPPRFVAPASMSSHDAPMPPPPQAAPASVQSYDEFSTPPPAMPAGLQSHNEPPALPRVEPPAPAAQEETADERERRLRASKTEIVEVGKIEGAPAKRGWWRRGG